MKHILMICYYFAPASTIGAVRPTKLAKLLSQRGYTVDVVTSGVGANGNSVPKEIAARNTYVMQHESPAVQATGGTHARHFGCNWRLVRAVKSHIRFSLSLRRMNAFYDYFKNLCKHELANNTYDIVFSTFGPLASLRCGLCYKKMHPEVKWICDFRDPAVVSVLPALFKPYMASIQKRACRRADTIVAVSNGYLQRICKGKYAEKAHMITNGYDKTDFPADLKTSPASLPLHFTYTGILYAGKRDASMLFRVFRELIDAHVLTEADIRFDYAGGDFSDLTVQAKRFDLESILINHGQITREAALQLQYQSHFLVLLTWNDKGEEGVFPGKFLEYMLMKKPIVSLTCGALPDGEVTKVLREGNMGIAYEQANHAQDYAKLKEYICNQVEEFKQQGAVSFAPDLKVVERYDYEQITSQIERVF